MLAMQEVSTQRHGMVHVVIGNPTAKFHQYSLKTHVLANGLPGRTISIHLCLIDRTLNRLIQMVLLATEKENLVRLRIHLEGRFRVVWSCPQINQGYDTRHVKSHNRAFAIVTI